MTTTLVNINSPSIWLAFLTGLFVVECILLFTFRTFPKFWGNTINVWYDNYGLVAILLDVLIVLIGFWITQWLYGKLFGEEEKQFKLWKFILLFLAVQIIHDILFYILIIKPSKGSNTILELLQNYGKKHGALTIAGDSLMVVLAILFTYFLLDNDLEFGSYIIILLVSVYLIGYLLFQKWQ